MTSLASDDTIAGAISIVWLSIQLLFSAVVTVNSYSRV